LPVVFFYDELYNLSGNKHTMIVEQSLFNNQGLKVFSKKKSISPSTNSIVDVGMINMIKYPTDVYNLVITIQDTAAKNGALASKRFFYYNPELIDTTINNLAQKDYISSEFGVMNEDELDLLFHQCKYIATADEIDRYEKLTSIGGKREFLFKFWKKRDPNIYTKRNEFKEEYMKRINFVEHRFRVMNKRGYLTDRGRVYLMFGEWDQIDRFPNPTNRKPYEIWYYNSIEGGVIFVFADLTGYNDYELLHSTKRGEIQDYRWQNRIIQN
jgi:GWxTD domain-containing protein